MSRVRVAVIGCGGRGKNHIKAMDDLEDVDLVAVCDPVEESREAAGNQYYVKGRYASSEEMFDQEDLDAVVVATPAFLNAKAALPCLEQGIDTLMEKPPGMSAAETRGLRDAAAKTGAKGMVGWDRRFNPYVTWAYERVRARGPVTQMMGEFHKNIVGQASQGRFPEDLLDNYIWESPIHSIDLVRGLAESEVAEVQSIVRRSITPYKDVHAATVLFESGCIASLMFNLTTGNRRESYEIHGDGISAYLEGIKQGTIYVDKKPETREGENRSDADDNSTTRQDRFFIDCVKEDRPITFPAANLDEAVKTMELGEKILAGLRE